MTAMQSLLRAVYPPGCVACDAPVAAEHALCGPCWRDTPFITGLVCDCCGYPLPGDAAEGPALCDDCLVVARPWEQGRAAMLYAGQGRRFVLRLKHGDRLELARPAARWMAAAARPILRPGMLVAPVPLHWTRLLRRRYNQAAVLAQALARAAGLESCPDLLVRPRRTASQDGRDLTARYHNLDGALQLHPRRGRLATGRRILLVDDVMTSGATLAAAADTCLAGGALEVHVAVLARVPKREPGAGGWGDR